MTSGRIRVLIADDDQLVRTAIGLILATLTDIEVIAECADGRAAVNQTVKYRPEVVLLDIQMPVLDGLAALRQIRAAAPTPVLMLTTFGEAAYVDQALAAGAAGFLLKDSAADELPAAIRAAAAGKAFLNPAVTRELLDRLPGHAEPVVDNTAALETLSEREREVLILIGKGMTNAAISAELWISEATVKTHVSRVLTKLDCENRVQAALLIYRTGLTR
ncbi:response regulator transcription factor [Actinoplanes sp. TFC3]|uniref:response regulator transcription factor n=1 Tax=Actinoplanes sp. TFC3 TaxID=1710355 RepID=UPI0008338F02|nr:response regulator transcription factor [Actinoplanes sp. TFC3]